MATFPRPQKPPAPSPASPLGQIEDEITARLATEEDATYPHRYVALKKAIPAEVAKIVRRVHRGEDSFVRFVARVEGAEDLAPVGSVPPDGLDVAVPHFSRHLAKDAYFSINGFWREATSRSKDIRYLNAAYADLDILHEGAATITIGGALRIIDRAQFQRVIPPASLIVESGRGIWLLYLLLDTETGKPPRGFNDSTIPLHREINRKLAQKLNSFAPELHADENVIDPSRLLRVAGSINTSAKDARPVTFWVQADQMGRGFVYTLRMLADAVGASLKGYRSPAIPTKSGVKVPERRRGWDERWRRFLDDLSTLEGLRDGFRTKTRNNACFVLAYTLRKLGKKDEYIRAGVQALAKRCKPPLTPAQAENAFRSVKGATMDILLHMSGKRAAELLAVNAEEEERLTTIRRKPRPKEEAPSVRERRVRRALITEMLTDVPPAERPSLREIVAGLNREGVNASVETVRRDLDALKLT